MLRSIELANSWSRDHVILVITSSRLANGTHFNADRQFRQTWRHRGLCLCWMRQWKSHLKFDNGNLIWLNYGTKILLNPIKILQKDRFTAKYSPCPSWTRSIYSSVINSRCTNPTRVHRLWLRVHDFTRWMERCFTARELMITTSRVQWNAALESFSTLTLLVGCQEGHLACKKWVVRYWHGCCP